MLLWLPGRSSARLERTARRSLISSERLASGEATRYAARLSGVRASRYGSVDGGGGRILAGCPAPPCWSCMAYLRGAAYAAAAPPGRGAVPVYEGQRAT